MRKEIRCAVCDSKAVEGLHATMAAALGIPVEAFCSTKAEKPGVVEAPQRWEQPYCPRCDKRLTLEGLLLEEIEVSGTRMLRVVGKGGAVIWEHRAESMTEDRPTQDDAKRFLRRILELEAESRRPASDTASIAQVQSKWNKKAAARHFRRWFYVQYRNRPLEISDPALRNLAVRVLNEAPGRTLLEDERENDLLDFGEKVAGGYRKRAFAEQPLIVSRLSPATRLMVVEAQNASRYGLFRAVFAICRASLEDVLRDVVSRLPNAPAPIDDMNLQVLINCLPNSVLTPRERAWAHEVRENGNAAVHDASRSFDIFAAWRNLEKTTFLVQKLLEKAAREG